MASYSSLRDSWQPKLAPQSGARVTHFHRGLKSSSGQLVTELQVTRGGDCRPALVLAGVGGRLQLSAASNGLLPDQHELSCICVFGLWRCIRIDEVPF